MTMLHVGCRSWYWPRLVCRPQLQRLFGPHRGRRQCQPSFHLLAHVNSRCVVVVISSCIPNEHCRSTRRFPRAFTDWHYVQYCACRTPRPEVGTARYRGGRGPGRRGSGEESCEPSSSIKTSEASSESGSSVAYGGLPARGGLRYWIGWAMCESEIEMNEGRSEWMPQFRLRMWTRKSTNKVLLGSGRKGRGEEGGWWTL